MELKKNNNYFQIKNDTGSLIFLNIESKLLINTLIPFYQQRIINHQALTSCTSILHILIFFKLITQFVLPPSPLRPLLLLYLSQIHYSFYFPIAHNKHYFLLLRIQNIVTANLLISSINMCYYFHKIHYEVILWRMINQSARFVVTTLLQLVNLVMLVLLQTVMLGL